MPRRSQKALEAAVQGASNNAAKAIANYELGLFHDNNGREAAAIPHYRAALTLGLDDETRAKCLAWLASSFYKTGQSSRALACAIEAEALSRDVELNRFITGLKRRIERRMMEVTSNR
jgi:hypothetical protein